MTESDSIILDFESDKEWFRAQEAGQEDDRVTTWAIVLVVLFVVIFIASLVLPYTLISSFCARDSDEEKTEAQKEIEMED